MLRMVSLGIGRSTEHYLVVITSVLDNFPFGKVPIERIQHIPAILVTLARGDNLRIISLNMKVPQAARRFEYRNAPPRTP